MAINVGGYRPSGGQVKDLLMNAGAGTIYPGDIVMCLAAGTAYAGAVDDNDPETTGASVFGVALEEKTYAAATDKIRCDIGGAEVLVTYTSGSAAQANVGDEVFVDGAQTVDATGGVTDQVKAGMIIEIVSATKVWVKLEPFGSHNET